MKTIETHLKTLIEFQSISPFDVGCQSYMIDYLSSLGFECQVFDNPPVSNFFARFGQQSPLLIFAGHTDVVPVGDESKWNTPPFTLTKQNDMLYGRGTADMKGSIAAMMVAAERWVQHHEAHNGSLGFLITSGEEGDHYHLGTPYVMQQLNDKGIHPQYCIVGEPSSTAKVGDVIKIGRRGSLNAKLTLHGKQGHVAYPHLADNPIHALAPVLKELVSTKWDEGNAHFPPTSFQITHIQAGGHGNNVIPGTLTLNFNIRYSTEQTEKELKKIVHDCFSRHGLSPLIEWQLSGMPFLTANGRLLERCQQVIKECLNFMPECSTSGGTSDGRFIAPFGVEVIELGPVNATIHQVNECVRLQDLETLSNIYLGLCNTLLEG